MAKTTFQLLLLLVEIACFIGLFCLYINARRQKKRIRKEAEKISEILSTSPAGFFYFLPDENTQICSRRLAVQLGIYEACPSFDILLKKLSSKSQTALIKSVSKLRDTGRGFSLKITTAGENRRLVVQGIRCASLTGRIIADILWFDDQTELLEKNETFQKQLNTYELRDDLFVNALDALPFAVWLRNADLSLAYCNRAYSKLAGKNNRTEVLNLGTELEYDTSEKMGAKLLAIAAKSSGEEKTEKARFIVDKKSRYIELHEVPLGMEKNEKERFTLGFAQDIQNEETLKESLQNYLKAQYQVLGALSSGIVIFDASGYVQFYNKAFCDLWKLADEWLITAPSYAGILDKLREKRVLPEEGNFLQYKHREIETFSTLTSLQEDILYLPNNRIYKRMMNPYPLGGVVMTFDDVTDKISLERSYNEQLNNQQSILNRMLQGLLIFNQEGRLKGYNIPYVKLFGGAETFLKSEPSLMDTLDSQKNVLSASDDIWEILKQKILLELESTDGKIELLLNGNTPCVLKSTHLPDGGLLLSYELKK